MNDIKDAKMIMEKNKSLIKSEITHHRASSRVYLMKLHHGDFPEIIEHLEAMAIEKNYTKIFAKVPANYSAAFINAGYLIEAFIPDFYKGNEDVMLLAKYYNQERRIPEPNALSEFQQMLRIPVKRKFAPIDKNYIIKALDETYTEEMAELFKLVFESYPFPVFDPVFLNHSMLENSTRYYGVFYKQKLVAISSAECDITGKNAEMTDFAVHPEHRGKQLSIHLLSHMETILGKDGFKTLYTIARLLSLPMNKTFYKMGYTYSGTLIRNTNISGKIESMNVWYKRISD